MILKVMIEQDGYCSSYRLRELFGKSNRTATRELTNELFDLLDERLLLARKNFKDDTSLPICPDDFILSAESLSGSDVVPEGKRLLWQKFSAFSRIAFKVPAGQVTLSNLSRQFFGRASIMAADIKLFLEFLDRENLLQGNRIPAKDLRSFLPMLRTAVMRSDRVSCNGDIPDSDDIIEVIEPQSKIQRGPIPTFSIDHHEDPDGSCFDNLYADLNFEELVPEALDKSSNELFDDSLIYYFSKRIGSHFNVKIQSPIKRFMLSPFNSLLEQGQNAQRFQVHHVRDNHWVASFLRGENGLVYVADSMFGTLTYDQVREMINLWVPYNQVPRRLTFRRLRVQIQKGKRDCGPFALAFCLMTMFDLNVEELRFKQPQLRALLLGLHHSKHGLNPFPSSKHKCDDPPVDLTIEFECVCKKAVRGSEFSLCSGKCRRAYHGCLSSSFIGINRTGTVVICHDCLDNFGLGSSESVSLIY